jgi:hypothetical protein
MRALLGLFALLNSSLAFAQTPTPHLEEMIPSDEGSIAGELDISPAQDEAIHINFQYGSAPELSNTDPQALSDLATNIAGVQAATGGTDSAVFYVPEDYAGPDLPAAVVQKVHPHTVIVPKNLIQKFKSAFQASYVTPTRTERTMGIVFGTTRAAISGLVWFSAPGVSPELATLMTLSIGGITGFNNVFNQTLNNLFAYGLAPRTSRLGRAYRSTVIMTRSMAYDFTFSNLLNAFSGMRNSVEQNTVNFAASGTLSQVAGAQRNTLLAGRRHLNISYTLLLAPLTYTIGALEATGNLHAVFNLGFYAVRPTMIATVAIYAAAIVANTFFKDKVVALLTKVDAGVNRFITSVSARFNWVTQGFCEHSMDDVDDRALPN